MNTDELYKKGFNAGYFLTKYEYNLIQVLIKNIAILNYFFEGIIDGKERMEKENEFQRVSNIKKLRYEQKDEQKYFSNRSL